MGKLAKASKIAKYEEDWAGFGPDHETTEADVYLIFHALETLLDDETNLTSPILARATRAKLLKRVRTVLNDGWEK